MKVIQVTGLSGSGKTTFIRALVPLLAGLGTVGTVKHTGHHAMEIPKGKDTTVMFEAGARAVAGIDLEKTLVTMAGTSLTEALDILADHGVALAVIEGYKGSPLPKIVIGDLEAEGTVLRNPDPSEVIPALDRFPDYFSPREVMRELGERCGGGGRCVLVSSQVPLPAGIGDPEKTLPGIAELMEGLPGILGARAVVRRGSLFGGTDEILVAVGAEDGGTAAAGLGAALSLLGEMPGPE
ncbi:MAG TPA: molybdopterin-guanine dinucleotide biosynthesis protein B [Methanomicrobiales archaeon]|nr:molybdopterin-guanine dinucleotide biosynthesis protein B [Methanomicrobiales archaeon]